ncbi:GFA family protein [Asticcacaulis taihuensis]|uniref:Uncharacterized conserved protein n=1 Tax=Asticcacaulis taihuensis TaxID=260084 RepID=A0A1G4TCM4_9CAUL|nr:GFA family protein [Asticcacaulis taihuensis]SCW78967.1 Uncharacterized conserved protein [Asticcacaulis taihuensis]
MTVKGSCHCGATQFTLEKAPETVTRCTCSICSKRGALWAYYTPDQIVFDPANDPAKDSEYRWQSRMVGLHFCNGCGCTTYNVSPSWVDYKPDFDHPQIAINARLLEGFDLDAVPVQVLDGRNLW